MNDEPIKLTKEQERLIAEAKHQDEARRLMLVNIDQQFDTLLRSLQNTKPNERSEEARRFAVTIMELEKVAAYYKVYIAL